MVPLLICYNATKEDTDIAILLGYNPEAKKGIYSPYRIATLRGMYDARHPGNELDTSNILEAAGKLMEFKKGITRDMHNKVVSAGSNLSETYTKMKNAFTASERFDRINMVADLVSNYLDILQANTPKRSRADFLRGYVENGEKRGGQFMIFDGIYNRLVDLMYYYVEKSHTDNGVSMVKAEKISRVLENWDSIVTFTRALLRTTEDIKLGNSYDFAVDASIGTLDSDALDEIFVLEESKHDGYSSTNEMKSAFSTTGKRTRAILRMMGECDFARDAGGNMIINSDGLPQIVMKTDDLGCQKKGNPIVRHRELIDIVRGAMDSRDMMLKMRNAGQKVPWINKLIAYLEKHPDEIKGFWTDMHRSFQELSSLEYSDASRSGILKFKTQRLNKVRDKLTPSFKFRIAKGNKLSKKDSVYDSSGNVNWENLRHIRFTVMDWLSKDNQNNDSQKNVFAKNKFWSKGGSTLARRDFIVDVSRALGLDVDADIAGAIMNNTKDLSKYLENLHQLFTHGIDKKSNLPKVLKDRFQNNFEYKPDDGVKIDEEIKYSDLISNQGRSAKPFEKILKLNEIISKYKQGLKVESRVSWRDSKGNRISLNSDINPNYMGDKFELIKRYVENDDKVNLKKWLENTYLSSPFFMDKRTGKIYNRWLKDMYDACNNGDPLSETLGDIFYYKRFLGTKEINFEDFTSRQEAVDLLYEYRSDIETSQGENTALYPIFILGDANVRKFVRQKIYSNEEIIEELYNIYEQELQRQKLVESTNKFLTESGKDKSTLRDKSGEVLVEGTPYGLIDNYSESASKFSILTFLNEEKYKLPTDATKDDVINVIKDYLNDAYDKWKSDLEKFGVLETKEVETKTLENNKVVVKKDTKYVYLDQFLNGRPLDEALKECYLNTKFATIEQLQLMTIDPSFYPNSKMMQKRYKEIHAPGTELDIYATYNCELVSDGIERCIYFDDVVLDSDELNKEFMEFLKSIYKDKPSIWKSYNENSLTNGQGYRTLTSYRKVLLMHDYSWTEEMEDAYQRIMTLRSRYGKEQIPKEYLAEIEKLAVRFKPLKPCLFSHEKLTINDDGDTQLIPVFHKYAEAVIIPELLPEGSKLRDLGYWMDEHTDDNEKLQPIDMVCSTEAVKVGVFGTTKIDHLNQYDEEILKRRKAIGDKNEHISDTERLNFAMNRAYVHEVSYADYKIQTNVPNHVYEARKIGTQLRKLVMYKTIRYKNGEIVEPVDKKGNYRYEHYVDYNKVNLGNGKKVRLTGRNLVAFYNALNIANFLDSFDTFKQAISNNDKLSKGFMQNIINNGGALDNILSYSLDKDGEFVMPLFEGSLEHDSSAFMLSMFRKFVNEQLINGGSAVQASAMGISDYSETGGLNIVGDYVTDENGDYVYLTDDKGNYILDSEGNKVRKMTNILWLETEIPFDFSYTDENGKTIQLNYDDYCNEDGTFIMKGDKPLIEWDFPGITDVIAYRIPTEREYSIINLKVVRCSRKIADGTIKLPLEATTIAGFDFDIDKLFFMRKEFVAKKSKDKKKNIESSLINRVVEALVGSKSIEWEEYNFDNTPLENTRVARNNMIINIVRHRLMDPETIEARTTPGGFAGPKKAAKTMKELVYGELNGIMSNNSKINWGEIDRRVSDKNHDPEPNYDPSEPSTLIYFNQINQIADKLIGIFANDNINHALASLLKTFRITDGMEIEFAGHTKEEGYGFDLINSPKGVDTALNLAEYLAAAVDAVKEAVLNYMNFNTLTANSAGLLTRIGYNTLEIGLLFSQPIIKEVCEYALNNDISLEEAIDNVNDKYLYKKDINGGKKAKFETIVKAKGDTVSKDSLALNIIKYRENSKIMDASSNSEYIKQQLEILNLFKHIASVASEVNEFVQSTRFTASNSVKSTCGDMYAQQMRVDNYINSKEKPSLKIMLSDHPDLINKSTVIMNDKSNLEKLKDRKYYQDYMDMLLYNPLGYEQCMFDLNRMAISSMSKFFPYETDIYRNVRDEMRNLTKTKYLDGNTINSIHRDLLVYLLAMQEYGDFNGEIIKKGKLDQDRNPITARDYYTKYFPDELLEFLQNNPEMNEMPIFKYMLHESKDEYDSENSANVTGYTTMNIIGIGGLDAYAKDEITESWSELNEQYPEIARDLFLYNFYKLGFDFSPVVFMNLAPTDVKKSIRVPSDDNPNRTYVDFLKEVLAGKFHYNIQEFIIQYLKNHTENKSLVYNVKSDSSKTLMYNLAVKAKDFVDEFTLNANDPKYKNAAKAFILESDKSITRFRPAILYNGVLYIAQSKSRGVFNESSDGTMTYVKTNVLGSKTSKGYYNMASEAENNDITIDPGDIDGNTSGDPTVKNDTDKVYFNDIVTEVAKAFYEMSKEDKTSLGKHGEQISVKYFEDEFMRDDRERIIEYAKELKLITDTTKVVALNPEGKEEVICS